MNSKVKLSFTKRIEKKVLQPSALKNDNVQVHATQEKQTIDSFDKNSKSIEIPKEEELVIPMVANSKAAKSKEKSTNSSSTNREENPSSDAQKTLEELAAAAVEQESKHKNEDYSQRTSREISAIQVESSNNLQIPDELGKISSLDDYDQINVESFGSALLRGMGWNKAAGIGRKNKKVVDIVEPTSKTFSLDIEQNNSNNDQNQNEEEEDLKKGSYIFIKSGRNRGTYALVESIDEDHMLVKSARGGPVLREVEANIKVVSSKEYHELSRVINKEMYDEYKMKSSGKSNDNEDQKSHLKRDEDESNSKPNSSKERDQKDSQNLHQESKIAQEDSFLDQSSKVELKPIPQTQDTSFQVLSKQKREQPLEAKPIPNNLSTKYADYDKHSNNTSFHDEEKYSKDKRSSDNSYSKAFKKSSKYDDEEKDSSKYSKKISKTPKSKISKYEEEKRNFLLSQAAIPALPWATERLRVRIINKKYRDGRYHKEKVVVQSLETVEMCSCITANGKLLEDLNPAWFETVIPKEPSAIVLILKGAYKGEKARILMLHKEKEKASLQLLQDSSVVFKLHYDDICEYVTR